MFHAFAHTCHQEKGHQLYYHTACQKAIEAVGLSYHAYIPKRHTLPLQPKNWILHFPEPYNRLFKKEYLKCCYELFCKAEGPRFFFIETIMRRDMRYFSLAALRFGCKEDKICLLFRDNNLFKRQRDRLEVRLFLSLLKRKFRKNLSLFTDTDNLSTFFKTQTGLTFHTLPIPHFDLEPKRYKQEKPLILFPGEPRKEKGGPLIEKLAHNLEGFQLACSKSLPVGDLHFENSLPRQEYVEWLQRSSVVVLPYDAKKYRFRSSGIFVEAISLGKLTLVPDGCWMADELRKHDLEDCIVDFDNPHLIVIIKKLYENLAIREKLKSMQKQYLAFHTPESFGRKLYEVANLSSASCALC